MRQFDKSEETQLSNSYLGGFMVVVINGRNHEVGGEELTYQEIVEKAHPGSFGLLYLISYSYQLKNKGGTLAPNSPSAEIEQGMIFNCHNSI
jgi:hypothetical protein